MDLASSSGLSSPDWPIPVLVKGLLLKTDVITCHKSRYVVSEQWLAQAGQVASEKCRGNMYRGMIPWEVSFCSLYHFAFKTRRWHLSMFHMLGMPERHSQWVGPHIARAQCPSWVLPMWGTQRPGTWGTWGQSPPRCPARCLQACGQDRQKLRRPLLQPPKPIGILKAEASASLLG